MRSDEHACRSALLVRLLVVWGRYQGVDWRDEASWNCNQKLNPTGELYFDGTTLTPYEVVFVKYKAILTQSHDSITLDALRLGTWMSGLVCPGKPYSHRSWQSHAL